MNATLRVATPADLATVLPIVADFHHHEKIATTPAHRETALRGLLSDPRLGAAVLAERQGKVVGYALLCLGYSVEFGGRDAFVDELYVAPEARGTGVGQRLLAELETIATKQRVVALHLEVDHANPRAHDLYKRLGYRDHDRHLMTKRLGTR